MTAHWTACQVFSKRLLRIRDELEKSGRAVCVPTYKRRWYTDGKLSVTERVLFPGYILFRTDSAWGDVGAIEGVVRVLANDGRAGVVRDDEFARLFLDHATGRHDELQAVPAEPERRTRRRRRRPRPGRRWRARNAAHLGAA